MRVIFLDFDGVINTVGSMVYNNRLRLNGLTDTPSTESFDPIACSNLEYVLEELPDVMVVVSSTWRIGKTLNALKEIFKTNHVLPDRMIGTTPITKEGYRGKEIEMYLKANPEITDFVIIDDDSDMEPYMDRLIQTKSEDGLTFSMAQKVIEKFESSSAS